MLATQTHVWMKECQSCNVDSYTCWGMSEALHTNICSNKVKVETNCGSSACCKPTYTAVTWLIPRLIKSDHQSKHHPISCQQNCCQKGNFILHLATMHNKYAVTQLFWTIYFHLAINDQQVLTWGINFICFTAIHTGDCCIHLRVFRTLHGTPPHTQKENEMK